MYSYLLKLFIIFSLLGLEKTEGIFNAHSLFPIEAQHNSIISNVYHQEVFYLRELDYSSIRISNTIEKYSDFNWLKKKINQLIFISSLILLGLLIIVLILVKANNTRNKQTLRLSEEKLRLLKDQEETHKQLIKEKDEHIVNIKEQLAQAIGIERPELRTLDFTEIIKLTDLKPRHIKPLIALSSGLTNQKEMAVQLKMEVGTLRKYIQQIREILDVPSTLKILPKLYEIIDENRNILS